MIIYRISSQDIGGNRYPWVSGYGPLEKMPFFDSFPQDLKEMKLASWKINNSPRGLEIDPGGKTWSHVMGCGGGPPCEFFSEQVIEDLLDEGVSFLRATKMPIATVLAKRLKMLTPPQYHVLEAAPGLKIWSESIPIEEQIAAKNENPPRWIGPYLTKCEISTWNGADLFSPSHGRALTALFCTDRVKDLAERKGWANIEFKPLKVV